jgi:hypothetical protein
LLFSSTPQRCYSCRDSRQVRCKNVTAAKNATQVPAARNAKPLRRAGLSVARNRNRVKRQAVLFLQQTRLYGLNACTGFGRYALCRATIQVRSGARRGKFCISRGKFYCISRGSRKIFLRAFCAFFGFCARSEGQSQGDPSGTPPNGGTLQKRVLVSFRSGRSSSPTGSIQGNASMLSIRPNRRFQLPKPECWPVGHLQDRY